MYFLSSVRYGEENKQGQNDDAGAMSEDDKRVQRLIFDQNPARACISAPAGETSLPASIRKGVFLEYGAAVISLLRIFQSSGSIVGRGGEVRFQRSCRRGHSFPASESELRIYGRICLKAWAVEVPLAVKAVWR